jgi:hypothetical protein
MLFTISILDVIGFLFGIVLLVPALFVFIRYNIKLHSEQSSCKHDGGVNETNACDAICKQCSKNLGFIGDWRKNNSTTNQL